MKRADILVSCVRIYSTCVQVSTDGLQSIPLSLVVSWRCEPTSTDLRIDYKYNGEAMTMPTALNNVQFLVPVDGGVSKLQAVLPPAAWYGLHFRVPPVFLNWFDFDFDFLRSLIDVFFSSSLLLTGMQSSKESFGRFLISHRNPKTEVLLL